MRQFELEVEIITNLETQHYNIKISAKSDVKKAIPTDQRDN